MERRLGRAPQRAEQPLGPAAQEIHGPRGAADAAAPGGPRPRPLHSAARGRTPASHTATSGVGGGDSGGSGHLPAGWAELGRPDAKLLKHLRNDWAQSGEERGRVGTERGRGERGGPGLAPPLPRAAGASPRCAAWEGCCARALETFRSSALPRLSFLKLRPNHQEMLLRIVNTHALLPFSAPPTGNLGAYCSGPGGPAC